MPHFMVWDAEVSFEGECGYVYEADDAKGAAEKFFNGGDDDTCVLLVCPTEGGSTVKIAIERTVVMKDVNA